MTGFLMMLAIAVGLVAVWMYFEWFEEERDAENEHVERTGGK